MDHFDGERTSHVAPTSLPTSGLSSPPTKGPSRGYQRLVRVAIGSFLSTFGENRPGFLKICQHRLLNTPTKGLAWTSCETRLSAPHTKPLSSEHGKCKTAKARFWPWHSGKVREPFQVVPSSLGSSHSAKPSVCFRHGEVAHRGTSLIRNRAFLGPYRRTMPRAVWQS